MRKEYKLSLIIFISIFIFDQFVKYAFVNFSWEVDGPYMSLKLAYNYGVAFSMFAFLQEYLKYIQLVIALVATIYLVKNKEIFYKYFIPISILYAAGLSNILDRFTYGAVVDYFYWHYGFEFAIFNIADVMINLAVAIIIIMQILEAREEKKKKSKS
ncbi:signal peptidase II [Halarcobacter bivalviorum]|uniref:Lipoprotein signal peptidase n=1 Tax=Halarcobacter bivalviorum TaxID=663364 RepID=A0AAX2A5I5_9BACT|nr:signal peptidase II [Halarcobacter bivalviorum]AXH11227.1 prolipoprotein signal peptidase II [Halarcobacter bivalviorum]RXK09499.1 signal peptidase II [Halarcobacter bivalviorum]